MELNRNSLWLHHDRSICLRFLTYAELLTTLALSDAKVIMRTFECRITPLLNESYLSLCQVKYAIKRFKVFQEILYVFRHILNLDEVELSDYYLLYDVYAHIKGDTKSEEWLADTCDPVEAKIRDNIKPIITLHDLNSFKREGTVHNNFIGQLEQYINILADDVMPVLNKMVKQYCPTDKAKDKVYKVGTEIVSAYQLSTTNVQFLRSMVSETIIRVSYDPCINDEELDRKRVIVANEYGEYDGYKADEEEDTNEENTETTDEPVAEASEKESEPATEVAWQARYIAYQPICAAIRECGSYPDGWEVVDVDERLFGHITSVNSEIGTAFVQWYKDGARCTMSIPLSMLIKADTGAFMNNCANLDKMSMEVIAASMEQRYHSFPHLMESMKDRIQDESRYDV